MLPPAVWIWNLVREITSNVKCTNAPNMNICIFRKKSSTENYKKIFLCEFEIICVNLMLSLLKIKNVFTRYLLKLIYKVEIHYIKTKIIKNATIFLL